MKKAFKFILRIISLAAIIALTIVLYPHVSELINDTILDGKYERTSVMLTQEMKKAGELTAIRHQETGLMEAKVDAAFIGTVGIVKAPYTYEIGLGFALSEVVLSATDEGIEAALPDIRMLYDQFQITGKPEISDWWQLMTEQRYQQMINDQHAACRNEYLKRHENMEAAWQAACEQLEELFSGWAGETVTVTFVHKMEETAALIRPFT